MSSQYVKVLNEVLRSYAALGDSRRYGIYFNYEFYLIEHNKSETDYLKKEFDLTEECSITFIEIDKYKFNEFLSKWFFFFESDKDFRNHLQYKLGTEEQEQEVEIFLRYLTFVLNIERIEMIIFEPDDPYILGIDYEYFLLKSSNRKFILGFSYMD